MPISGNKGEWSEIYTLLKLLSTGKLYAADSELRRIDHIFYDIIKVFRKEKVGELLFVFQKESQHVIVKKMKNDTILVSLPASSFGSEATYLLDKIRNGNTRTFTVERTEAFMGRISCEKLKAPAEAKSDITIQIHDMNTGYEPELGFSIKSRLGSPSTLLNPGKTTNFIYKVTGPINDDIMHLFNSGERKIRESFSTLEEAGCNISFFDVENSVFKNNLTLIDSDLPLISALMLVEFYVHGHSTILAALHEVKRKNELHYDLGNDHPFYEYKFKKLITESSLGMLPAKPWTGRADATGGYIIVREDGEILCYHLYNRNEFEDYLLNNTKFDTPSKSRYGFAKIYRENDNYFVKLNMQIRFIK